MRTVALTSLTIAAMLGFALNDAAAEIPWQDNLRTAHAQAQAQGKLLLLHFYSDNCVWCDRLEAGSFQNPTVAQAISQGFIPVKVHAAKNPKLTEMFKVTKYPTDVIVTTEGKTLLHTVSPQQPDRYVAMLSGVASNPTVASLPPATQPNAMPSPSVSAKTVSAPRTAPTVDASAAVTKSQVTATAPSYAKPATTVNAKTASMTAPTAAAVSPPAPAMNLPAVATTTTPPAKTSQFTLPGSNPASGTEAQMAAARSGGMTFAMPENTQEPTATLETKPEPNPAPKTQPELAMQGYCPVTVIKEDRWVEGNPKLGVIHLGKLYLFSEADKMQTFLADPVPYTPVLNEIDVVRFFEERVIVPGKREWGLKDPTYNRMFFFADEAAMNHFWNEYERYTGAAIEVMEKAIKDANPGT